MVYWVRWRTTLRLNMSIFFINYFLCIRCSRFWLIDVYKYIYNISSRCYFTIRCFSSVPISHALAQHWSSVEPTVAFSILRLNTPDLMLNSRTRDGAPVLVERRGAYLCSPVSMFPDLYVPRSYIPQSLCSPVLCSPASMFPITYVPRSLCSPVLCSPVSMLPSIYVPRYLCPPVPMFPSIYVPRYLYSPYPTIKDYVIQSQ